MNTLSLISFDEKCQAPIASVAGSVVDIYSTLDQLTELLEQDGTFWVEDVQLDEHTLIRRFATAEQGHVASLIVVGGVAEQVTSVY